MQQWLPGSPVGSHSAPCAGFLLCVRALSVPHLEIPDSAEVKVTPWESLAHPALWPPCPARPSSGGCLKVAVISGHTTFLRVHSPESPTDWIYSGPLSQRPWWWSLPEPWGWGWPSSLAVPSPVAVSCECSLIKNQTLKKHKNTYFIALFTKRPRNND